MNNNEFKQFQMNRRLLLLANLELLALLSTGSKTALSTSVFTELQIHLELLMDENDNIRKKSFGTLITYLHLDDFRLLETTASFKHLQKYFAQCHSLHGGKASWTLVFSDEERQKYAESRNATGEKLY